MKTKPLKKRQTRGLKQSEAHKCEAFLPVCRCKGTTFFGTCKSFPQKKFVTESSRLRKRDYNQQSYNRITSITNTIFQISQSPPQVPSTIAT